MASNPVFLEALSTIESSGASLIEFLDFASKSSPGVKEWVQRTAVSTYKSEMQALIDNKNGFHANASFMTEEKLAAFDIQEFANRMHGLAPTTWELLEALLSANDSLNYKRDWARKKAQQAKADAARTNLKGKDGIQAPEHGGPDTSGDDDEYWRQFREAEVPLHGQEEDEPENIDECLDDQRRALTTIKKVVCLSILMQSSNQRCNHFQSVVGVFLRSCNAPETAIELFAHMGVSVSVGTINSGVKNLSKEATAGIERAAKFLTALIAFDNLDIDLKHSLSTVENQQDSLIHITTGTLLPLEGISPDALNCSEELRDLFETRSKVPQAKRFDELLSLFPETPDSDGLLRRDRFIAWKFLSDLVEHGPDYFKKFCGNLKLPKFMERVSERTTTQVPLRAVDVSPSTPAGNAEALDNFLRQANIGDDVDYPERVSLGDSLLFAAGDLLTGQHIGSLQESRSLEETAWRRFQGLVFVPGVFHLKMACADAIWRIFISPPASRSDPNSLMSHVQEIRPKETGKIESSPGFRRMHEVIQQVGIVMRLDAARVIASKMDPAYSSLEEFAASSPSWEDIVQMGRIFARDYVARADSTAAQPSDIERHNILMRHQYFLLYEEITHAMNYGDVGQMESTYLEWSFIFSGCGKHKYAAELRRYLEHVHFVYPDPVKSAVRNNLFCNPTGKVDGFRGLDWLVEHNNLYIKRIYGGKYSNHQKARIIAESPLLQVYKNTRIQFEKMFCLEHKTTRHSPPKMKMTFKHLGEYMKKHRTNETNTSRSARYVVPDIMGIGMANAVTGERVRAEGGEPMDVDVEGGLETLEDHWNRLGDSAEEVLDDGSLDC